MHHEYGSSVHENTTAKLIMLHSPLGCVALLCLLVVGPAHGVPAGSQSLAVDLLHGPPRLPAGALRRQSTKAACSAEAFSKQTCVFANVCFLLREQKEPQAGSQAWSVTVVQPRANNSSRAAVLLRKHLDRVVEGTSIQLHYDFTDTPLARSVIKGMAGHKAAESISLMTEHAVTLLWQVKWNQESFGHALVNEAYPMFLSLSVQLGEELPQHLQVLVTPDQWQSHVLPHVLSDMVSPQLQLLVRYFSGLREQGKDGVCFRHLLLGDGGYVDASRASLANSGQQQRDSYATHPSMFNSRDWWSFRRHAMQVAGAFPEHHSKRPLVLLNDKRYYEAGNAVLQNDRRMILDIEQLANEIRVAYPNTDVIPVRFRELSWPDQLRLLSATTVFISTQGSSAFRLVFLPPGSTCIMVGSPELPGEEQWRSFHELDRWFPLSYVSFERYEISYSSTSDEFVVWIKPGHWQPAGEEAAKRWWLYNSHVRLRMARLKPMLDRAMLD